MVPLANLNFLSPDSRCYPFDARANGYSRGEGFGVVIIKRVTDAIVDGDMIRAVIRGVGAGQDGRTPGITQPNSSAQEALIRETYMKNDLDIGVTRFFEAHGTGTPVGDLVEARAISADFKDVRSSGHSIYRGSKIEHRRSGRRKWRCEYYQDDASFGERDNSPKCRLHVPESRNPSG